MNHYNATPYVDIHTHHRVGNGVVTITTVGVHPWDADTLWQGITIELGVEAIGEIGLDFIAKSSRERQQEIFERQLKIAIERNLPVVIHTVRSLEQVIRAIERVTPRAVIIHGFIGSVEMMQRAVSRGYYISYGVGTLQSPKSQKALRATPLDRLFFESDTSQTPISEIYSELSRVIGRSVEDMKDIIYKNYLDIFAR